jgi:hypothetical protein
MKMKRTITYGKRNGDALVFVTTDETHERDYLQKHGWVCIPAKQHEEVCKNLRAAGVEPQAPQPFAAHFGKSLIA